MISPSDLFAILCAYLIGSIPTAVWIGKYFYRIDVREHGSGNAGATNAFRVLGKKAGFPVLLIDIFKGWAAVNLAWLISVRVPGSEQFFELQMVLGVVALLGHIFPILAAFRGGKGIATLIGITAALHPQACLVSVGVFILVFIVTNYVSLSSIIASFAFPISLIFIFPTGIPSFIVFALFTVAMVLLTHQKNIERLLNKQETKTRILRKRSIPEPGEK